MMLALMKKDLPLLVFLFVTAAVTLVIVAASEHVAGAWVRLEQRDWAVLHCLMWAPTAVAAAALALRDPIGRTQELLRHRSVSPAQIYRAQVALGLVCVSWLTLILVLFDLLRLSWDGLLGMAFVDWMPIAFVLSGSILTMACFLVTLISLRLPIAWPGRVFALASLGLGVILVHSISASGWMREGYSASMSTHLVVMSALTTLLLWIGAKCTAPVYDPDLALPAASLRPLLWISTPLLLPLVALGLSLLQEGAREPLRELRPLLVATEGHGVSLARWQGREGYTLLDRDRNVLATGVHGDLTQWRVAAPGVWSRAPELFDYRLNSRRRSLKVWQRPARGEWTLVMADATGDLHVSVRSWTNAETPSPVRVRRPDERAFSRAAFFASATRRGERVFVADPEDRSVWKLEFDEKRLVAPRLVRTPLPGSSEIRSFGLARLPEEEDWSGALLCGDTGYVWDGSQWREAAATQGQRRAGAEVDALAPVVAAPTLEGGSAPELWTLSPHGFLEWSATLLFVSPSLLRPLPSALWAALAPDRGSRRHWSKDLVLGDYPWLLVLPLLGTALTALWMRRRLQRIGADPARLGPWLITAALLGPATLLLFLTIETKRAHRRLPLETRGQLRVRAREVA